MSQAKFSNILRETKLLKFRFAIQNFKTIKMKRTSLNIIIIMLITLGVSSCKEVAKESKTSEAKQTLAPTQEATPYTVITENSTIAWLGSKPTGKHEGTISVTEGAFYLKAVPIDRGNFLFFMNSFTFPDLDPNLGKERLYSHFIVTFEGTEGLFFFFMPYPTATF